MIALHDESDRITRAGDTWSYLTARRPPERRPVGAKGVPGAVGRPTHEEALFFSSI